MASGVLIPRGLGLSANLRPTGHEKKSRMSPFLVPRGSAQRGLSDGPDRDEVAVCTGLTSLMLSVTSLEPFLIRRPTGTERLHRLGLQVTAAGTPMRKRFSESYSIAISAAR